MNPGPSVEVSENLIQIVELNGEVFQKTENIQATYTQCDVTEITLLPQ